MLVKMGWQKGQGLGKDNTGAAEPVGEEGRRGREGGREHGWEGGEGRERGREGRGGREGGWEGGRNVEGMEEEGGG